MSNEQEKQAPETGTEALKKGFNYDLKSIENRIGHELKNIAIKAKGAVDPNGEDVQTARTSLMNARSNNGPGPVKSVTSFAETGAEIERKLNKNSILFSQEEKAQILTSFKSTQEALSKSLDPILSSYDKAIILDNFTKSNKELEKLKNSKIISSLFTDIKDKLKSNVSQREILNILAAQETSLKGTPVSEFASAKERTQALEIFASTKEKINKDLQIHLLSSKEKSIILDSSTKYKKELKNLEDPQIIENVFKVIKDKLKSNISQVEILNFLAEQEKLLKNINVSALTLAEKKGLKNSSEPVFASLEEERKTLKLFADFKDTIYKDLEIHIFSVEEKKPSLDIIEKQEKTLNTLLSSALQTPGPKKEEAQEILNSFNQIKEELNNNITKDKILDGLRAKESKLDKKFVESEKAEILNSIKEKRQALDNKLNTKEGIESLILQNLTTQTITNLDLSNQQKDILLESLSNSKVTNIVNGTETQERWSLPTQIMTLLTPANGDLSATILKKIFKKHLSTSDKGVPTINFEKVSEDVNHIIATGIPKDSIEEKRDMFGKLASQAALGKTFTTGSVKTAKEALSENYFVSDLMDRSDFRATLKIDILDILSKNQKSTENASEEEIKQNLEPKIKKGLISAVARHILPVDQNNNIKNFTNLINQSEISLETLVDPEFKKRILDPQGKIKKLDVETLQNIATELDAKRQAPSPSTPVVAASEPQHVAAPVVKPHIASNTAVLPHTTHTVRLTGTHIGESSTDGPDVQPVTNIPHVQLNSTSVGESNTDDLHVHTKKNNDVSLSLQNLAKKIGKPTNKFTTLEKFISTTITKVKSLGTKKGGHEKS